MCRRGDELDRVSLYTDAPSAFGEPLLLSFEGAEYRGERNASIRVLRH